MKVLDSGFQLSGFQLSGFRNPYHSGFRIPNHCGFRIPTAKICWIPDSLTWGELILTLEQRFRNSSHSSQGVYITTEFGFVGIRIRCFHFKFRIQKITDSCFVHKRQNESGNICSGVSVVLKALTHDPRAGVSLKFRQKYS